MVNTSTVLYPLAEIRRYLPNDQTVQTTCRPHKYMLYRKIRCLRVEGGHFHRGPQQVAVFFYTSHSSSVSQARANCHGYSYPHADTVGIHTGLVEPCSPSSPPTTVSCVTRLTGRSGSSIDPTPICVSGERERITERPIRNNGGLGDSRCAPRLRDRLLGLVEFS